MAGVPELNLHGLTVDEALFKLDSFLYDTFMGGLHEVWIVHGKGTGALRDAVRARLRHNSLVKSFRPGSFGEGGAGVTVVELAAK